MTYCSTCQRHRDQIDNTDRGNRYKEKLKNLEDTENFFDAHDLVYKKKSESIAKFIDRTLNELLGCTLKDLADEEMVDRICRALYKQEKVIDECKRNSKYPMFEGLLLCYIFHRMGKWLKELNEPQIAAKYKELKDSMDVECKHLLEECFRKDKINARETLGINYHQDIHGCKCEFSHETRLMEIAYQGKAYNFLTHPVCQKAIHTAWHSSNKLNNPCVSKRSASSKFAFDRAFRVFYVIIYSVALIINSVWDVQKKNILEFVPLILVIGWQCTYIIEMIGIAVKGNFCSWAKRNRTDRYRNILIIINIPLFVSALLVWSARWILLALADLFFHVSYIMAIFCCMQIISFFDSIVYTLNKMGKVMQKFLVTFAFVWVAYVVSHISLSRHMKNANNAVTSIPWLIFSHGAFEIFGEAEKDDKEGKIDFCNGVEIYPFTDYTFHCLFRTLMLPLVLFLYILFTATLLFNLLTALLVNRYEEISKELEYRTYTEVGLYARLADYEESFSIMQRLLDFILFPVYMFLACFSSYNKSERIADELISLQSIEETLVPRQNVQSPLTPEELRDFIANCRNNMIAEQEINKKSNQTLDDEVKKLLQRMNIDADRQAQVEGFTIKP